MFLQPELPSFWFDCSSLDVGTKWWFTDSLKFGAPLSPPPTQNVPCDGAAEQDLYQEISVWHITPLFGELACSPGSRQDHPVSVLIAAFLFFLSRVTAWFASGTPPVSAAITLFIPPG